MNNILFLFLLFVLNCYTGTSQNKKDSTNVYSVKPLEILAPRPEMSKEIDLMKREKTVIDTTDKQLPKDKPNNFAFIYVFNIQGDFDSLNTFNNTFSIKFGDVDTMVSFRLNEDQVDSIYSMVRNIHFLNYPRNYKSEHIMIVLPHYSYYFKVRAGNYSNDLSIGTDICSNDPNTKNLGSLFSMIYRMIHAATDFKKIPEPKLWPLYE